MPVLHAAANDNTAPDRRLVRIIGHVVDGGRVVITDPAWRPSPQVAAAVDAWPNDPREP